MTGIMPSHPTGHLRSLVTSNTWSLVAQQACQQHCRALCIASYGNVPEQARCCCLCCTGLLLSPGTQERGHKQLGNNAAAAHLALIVSMVGLAGLWLWKPCAEEPYLCRLQSVGVGITYALFASQLIVAHMCKEPFQPPLWAMGLMALAIINKALHIVDPLQLTLGLDILLLGGYLHYVVVVINQICGHLGIYCLTIKPKEA